MTVGYCPALPETWLLAAFKALVSRLYAIRSPAESPAYERADGMPRAEAERVMDSHGSAILRLAYSYLHNMSDAEDILQETLIRYIEKAPRFESAEHEKAWLLCVAANLSKNRLKYERVRDTDELSDELAAEERDDLSFVWEAVKALPVNCREAVHLFYREGYSTAEIARILKRRESTVRSDLHRGRERLRSILKEAYDFE